MVRLNTAAPAKPTATIKNASPQKKALAKPVLPFKPTLPDSEAPIYRDYTFAIYRPDVVPLNVLTLLNQMADKKRANITDPRQLASRSATFQSLNKIGWNNLQRGFGESAAVLWMPQPPHEKSDDYLKLKQHQLKVLRDSANMASFGSIHSDQINNYWRKKITTLSPEEKKGLQQLYHTVCDKPLAELNTKERQLFNTIPVPVLLWSTHPNLALYPVHANPMLFQQQFNTRLQHHHKINPYQFHILMSQASHEPVGSLSPMDTPNIQTHVANQELYQNLWQKYIQRATMRGDVNYPALHLQDFMYRNILPSPHKSDPALGIKTILASINRALGGTFSIPEHVQQTFGPRWQNKNFLLVE